MRSGINLSGISLSITNKIMIVAMVLFWIAIQTNPSLSYYLSLNNPAIINGHIYSLLTYPFVENGLISIVFSGLMLAFIGTSFESSLGTPKYRKLFLVTALSGGIFTILLSFMTGKVILLSGMWGFIMTLFFLHAYESPYSEVYFFFIFKMKMITMIYLSLGILLLMAIFQGQLALWSNLFSVIAGFSYIRGFKNLSFLIPQNETTTKLKSKLGIKPKSNLKNIRSQGENFKTQKVVKITKPKDKPKT